jgi:hypothetical protein
MVEFLFHDPEKLLPVNVIYAFSLKRYVPERADWEKPHATTPINNTVKNKLHFIVCPSI